MWIEVSAEDRELLARWAQIMRSMNSEYARVDVPMLLQWMQDSQGQHVVLPRPGL